MKEGSGEAGTTCCWINELYPSVSRVLILVANQAANDNEELGNE